MRDRTPDIPDYTKLIEFTKIVKEDDEKYMGIPKKQLKEWINIVFSDLKKDKRLSIRERGLLLGIFATMGNVAEACFQLRIGLSSHKYWIKTNPIYKEYYDSIEDYLIDMIEGKLFKKAYQDEDLQAIKLYLESKAKDRGYSKESLITQNITPTQFIVDFGGPKAIEPEDKHYELLPPDSGSEGASDEHIS